MASFIADIRSPSMSSDIEMSDNTSCTRQHAAPQFEQFRGHMEIHRDRWGIILSYKRIQSYAQCISSGMSGHMVSNSAGPLEQ